MRRNTLTFIELIIVISIIALAVRICNYKKSDGKIVYTPTPIFAHEEQMSIVREYYYEMCSQTAHVYQDIAMQKTVNWLNRKACQIPPVPKGIVKACHKGALTINVTFDDGQNISECLALPSYRVGGLILK